VPLSGGSSLSGNLTLKNVRSLARSMLSGDVPRIGTPGRASGTPEGLSGVLTTNLHDDALGALTPSTIFMNPQR